MTKLNVEVLRAICIQGARVEPGSVIELASGLAKELIARGVASTVLAPATDEAPAKPARKRRGEGQGQ